MDFSAVCRTCLSDSYLNPIFVNPEQHTRYSAAVYITTGLKIAFSDGLPQQMCTKCMDFLNTSLKFRRKCREIETQLLQAKSNITRDKNSSNSDEDKKTVLRIEVKIEKDSKLDPGMDAKSEIKTEYTDYEVLEDDDDKPLKYLLERDSDDNVDDIIFVDNSMGDKEEEVNLKLEKTVQRFVDLPPPPVPQKAKPPRTRCPVCHQSLSARSIAAHMARRHAASDPRKIKCEFCDTYVLREKMNRHRKMVHGSGRTLRCGYCKSEFDTTEVLLDHVTTCTAKKKKRKVSESARELRECEICHKTMQKASLRMHKRIKHAGLRPVCEHCGKRFGNKFRLNEHYRAKHGYDKFKCSYCDFQSAAAMAMRNHERRHRGEKPFVCEQCGAKFHAAYLLAQHKQSHRTQKLVKCDLCPASFKARNSLHMHKLSCHSASLYQCSLCARAYSCRHYAVKHIRHVHDYKGPVPPLLRVPSDAGVEKLV